MTNTNAKVIAATTVWKMVSHLAGKPNAMLYSNDSRSAVSSVQATPGREDTRSRRCSSRLPGGRTLSGATLLVIATVNRPSAAARRTDPTQDLANRFDRSIDRPAEVPATAAYQQVFEPPVSCSVSCCPRRSGTRVRHRGRRDATAVQRRRRPVADDGRRRENRAQQGTAVGTDSNTRPVNGRCHFA